MLGRCVVDFSRLHILGLAAKALGFCAGMLGSAVYVGSVE